MVVVIERLGSTERPLLSTTLGLLDVLATTRLNQHTIPAGLYPSSTISLYIRDGPRLPPRLEASGGFQQYFPKDHCEAFKLYRAIIRIILCDSGPAELSEAIKKL